MLLLVRHGETAPNVQGLLLGRADPPLTDAGRRQAQALAAVLPPPTLVVSSPLRRAARHRGGVRSPGRGGRAVDRARLRRARRPAVLGASPRDAWARWRADASFAPPGGESLAALGVGCEQRATRSSSRRRDRHGGGRHPRQPDQGGASPGRSTCPTTIAWRMYVEDASVTRIDIEPAGPVVRWFNRGVLPAG